jgi:hypothetical protein
MSDSRMTGLALMAIATSAFVGTTSSSLPPVAFFPALALFCFGAIKFLRSNHGALEQAEKRAHKAVNPVLKQNRHAGAHAERQALQRGDTLNSATAAAGNANAVTSHPPTPGGFLEIENQPGDFVVETDVSFPVEVQSGEALADQLRKLNQLLEQGVLTAEEYAVAKTKLLS